MRTIAFTNVKAPRRGIVPVGISKIGSTDIPLAMVGCAQPHFDEASELNSGKVLVQVEAFSCNFRDKALAVSRCLDMDSEQSPKLGFFGSEFCGRVIATGMDVSVLSVGDRVMPDAEYPVRRHTPEIPAGIVTNEASRGWLVLHESQLIHVPELMSSEQAASFCLGAQTANSMVRRSGIEENQRALVMSGHSNTSLFLIQVLLSIGASVTIASGSLWSTEQKSLFRKAKFIEGNEFLNSASGGFDVVFDPFSDLNIQDALSALSFFGKYITCGFQCQHPAFSERERPENDLVSAITQTIAKNLSIIGNCIGTHHDLENAIAQFNKGDLRPILDSIWTPQQCVEFFDKSFGNTQRFGKVTMVYKS